MCSGKLRYRTFKRAWRASNYHDRAECWKCAEGRYWGPYWCDRPGHGVHLGHTTRPRVKRSA